MVKWEALLFPTGDIVTHVWHCPGGKGRVTRKLLFPTGTIAAGHDLWERKGRCLGSTLAPDWGCSCPPDCTGEEGGLSVTHLCSAVEGSDCRSRLSD